MMVEKLFVWRKWTVTQVRKSIREQGQWSGYLLGNKTSPDAIEGPWRLGCEVCLTSLDELKKHSAAFYAYLDPELGNRVAYYSREERS